MGIFESEATARWQSTALPQPGATASESDAAVLEMPEQGVWALSSQAGAPGPASRLVLDNLRSEAGTGDDLTASLLKAHRQIARQAETSSAGADVLALRLQASSLNYELAWIGEGPAFQLRDGELRRLTGDAEDSSWRLGGEHAGRLPIARKFGQARRGDLFLLCTAALAAVLDETALRAALRGIWSRQYKARRLQQSALKLATTDQRMDLILIDL